MRLTLALCEGWRRVLDMQVEWAAPLSRAAMPMANGRVIPCHLPSALEHGALSRAPNLYSKLLVPRGSGCGS